MLLPFTNMTDISNVLNESNVASRWDHLV